jgi:hypothetical protein
MDVAALHIEIEDLRKRLIVLEQSAYSFRILVNNHPVMDDLKRDLNDLKISLYEERLERERMAIRHAIIRCGLTIKIEDAISFKNCNGYALSWEISNITMKHVDMVEYLDLYYYDILVNVVYQPQYTWGDIMLNMWRTHKIDALF